MPLYEYECQQCHYRFEVLVSSASSSTEVTCRQCQSGDVKKMISAPNPGTNSSSQPTFASSSSCPTNSPFR